MSAAAEAYVGKHAKRRGRQRMQLPARAVRRLARQALSEGLRPEDCGGPLGFYMTRRLERHREMHGSFADAAEVRFFAGSIFIFVNATLITCWPAPQGMGA